MAQEYVAMYRSRWSADEDWRALSMPAQWLYDLLVTHPDRNAAGLLPLTMRKWARLARGLGVDQLRASLQELDDTGFVVVDEDTEEVLVRSYIRRAEVFKHIRLFRNACVDIRAVESERIRSALGQELVRLPKLHVPEPNGRNDRSIAEAVEAQEWLDELASMLCDAPPDPPGHGVAHPTAHPTAHPMDHPMGHPMADPMADPMAHPPGVGAGVGVGAGAVLGSCSSFEKESLESNARVRRRLAAVPDLPAPPTRKAAVS